MDQSADERLKPNLVVENKNPLFKIDLWPKLKSLTHINLSTCKILQLPDALESMECLQDLQLSHNQLSTLPNSIRQLKHMKRLNVAFNSLSDLPHSFSELNVLEVLDLSHNLFVKPPLCFETGCIRIRILDISFNKLEEWNTGPLCAHGLKSLYCGHNALKKNPSWIWGDFCRSLEDLDLSFNCFMDFSWMAKTYTLWRTGVTVVLKTLNLTNCGVVSNQVHVLHKLKGLKKLHLGNVYEQPSTSVKISCRENFLWDLSFKPFQSVAVLSELCLSKVGLSLLSEDISCLENLEILNCCENHIQWLPDSFSKLGKLRIASFSKNKILYLPETLGNLTTLEELHLDGNQLTDLPPSFLNLEKLQWLDLYSNQFQELPSFFGAVLQNLSGLDLADNLLNLNSYESLCLQIQTLQDAFRQHFTAVLGRFETRSVLQRTFSEESYRASEDEGTDSDSTMSTYEDRDCGDTVENESNHSEENWDLDEGADDYFDPTCMPPPVRFHMPARALIIHEVVLRPDSFCPSDIHPSPTIRASKDPFALEDGQFEDV